MDGGGDYWGSVTHAYGPAVEVPGWIAGLRDPATAAECLDELYGSIVHQGTRYSATPLCIPPLIEAALDQAVPDRVGVLFLVQFCATGYLGDHLDWRRQRSRQRDTDERAAWDAVAGSRDRLRELLADPDRAVAGAAMIVLAWTGDASTPMLHAIESAVASADGRDTCNGWLAAVVLGQLPSGLAAPVSLTGPAGPGRFGAAVASLRFADESARPAAVDELCAAFASIEADRALAGSEFFMCEDPARVAARALAGTPPHLRDHANARLQDAIARGWVLGTDALDAYLRLNLVDDHAPATADALPAEVREALAGLLEPLKSWQDSPTIDHQIYELQNHGLPATRDRLAAWLAVASP